MAKTFGDRLRELRARRKLSQTELAAESGLALSVIFKLEQGVRDDPSWSTVCKLADALRIKVQEFRK